MEINFCILRAALRAPLVNFEEISYGRANGRSRGVPWRPCRFPIKQMPAGTRATPQAPASISPCSLGVRQRISPSLSLALLAREGFDRRTCRAACETRAGFTTCAFHSSYTYSQKLHWACVCSMQSSKNKCVHRSTEILYYLLFFFNIYNSLFVFVDC